MCVHRHTGNFNSKLFPFHPKVFKDQCSPSLSHCIGGRYARRVYFGLQPTVV